LRCGEANRTRGGTRARTMSRSVPESMRANPSQRPWPHGSEASRGLSTPTAGTNRTADPSLRHPKGGGVCRSSVRPEGPAALAPGVRLQRGARARPPAPMIHPTSDSICRRGEHRGGPHVQTPVRIRIKQNVPQRSEYEPECPPLRAMSGHHPGSSPPPRCPSQRRPAVWGATGQSRGAGAWGQAVVRTLLEAGARTDMRTAKGSTALARAGYRGNANVPAPPHSRGRRSTTGILCFGPPLIRPKGGVLSRQHRSQRPSFPTQSAEKLRWGLLHPPLWPGCFSGPSGCGHRADSPMPSG